MKFELGSMTQEFILLSATTSPESSWERVRQSSDPWVVIEQPLSRKKHQALEEWESVRNAYYVIDKVEFLEILDKHKGGSGTLEAAMNLEDLRSNDIVLKDGLTFHPRQGRGRHDLGRFTKLAVVVADNEPLALLNWTKDYEKGSDDFAQVTNVDLLYPKGPRAVGRRFEDTEAKGIDMGGTGTVTAAAAGISEKMVDVTFGAEFPESLAVHETAELLVKLVAGAQPMEGEHQVVPLSPDKDVVVRLSLSSNLEASACLSQTVSVPTGKEERALLFPIRGLQAGPAQIVVRLFQPGRGAEQVGYLKLQPTVTAGVTKPAALRVEGVAYAPTDCEKPDLVLCIEERPGAVGMTEVHFRITAGPNYPEEFEDQPLGKTELELNSDSYFQTRFAKIEKLSVYNDEDRETASRWLQAQGDSLYKDLLSQELKNELEKNGASISSIEIKTDGHHVPWEMIRLPERPADKRPKEFMAQRYEVTRWLEGSRPVPSLPLRDLIYVAPQYQAGEELAFAKEEVAYLELLKNRGVNCVRVPAREKPVLDSVEAGLFDVFHFVGHASQAVGPISESALQLEKVEQPQPGDAIAPTRQHTLEPLQLSNLKEQWGPRRPMVFFNACQSGRADNELVRSGGWADAVLGSKARAFIGTLWSVRDSAALLFSKTFYDALLGGKTFGQSARRAREAVAQTADPSWLAYVVYAHPNAKVIDVE